MTAFVQAQQGDEDGDGDLGAPAAAVYKGQSGGIVDVLEDSKDRYGLKWDSFEIKSARRVDRRLT